MAIPLLESFHKFLQGWYTGILWDYLIRSEIVNPALKFAFCYFTYPIKSPQNSVLVSYSAEDFLYNDVKKMTFFGLQGTEN